MISFFSLHERNSSTKQVSVRTVMAENNRCEAHRSVNCDRQSLCSRRFVFQYIVLCPSSHKIQCWRVWPLSLSTSCRNVLAATQHGHVCYQNCFINLEMQNMFIVISWLDSIPILVIKKYRVNDLILLFFFSLIAYLHSSKIWHPRISDSFSWLPFGKWMVPSLLILSQNLLCC